VDALFYHNGVECACDNLMNAGGNDDNLPSVDDDNPPFTGPDDDDYIPPSEDAGVDRKGQPLPATPVTPAPATPAPSPTTPSASVRRAGLSTGGAVAVSVVVTLAVVGLAMLAAYQVVSRRRAAPQLRESLTSAPFQATRDSAL
jgi:hypothetical protein